MALAWQELMDSGRMNESAPDMLDQLLDDPTSSFVEYCSERDRKVANTLIQWLGSPVGS